MKKIKVSEATGVVLDWLVAKCEKKDVSRALAHCRLYGRITLLGGVVYMPSTDWSQGGPIIEREGVLTRPIRCPGHELDGQSLAMIDNGNTGVAVCWGGEGLFYWSGPTTLIAAMRCYVASKLGAEVEVPEELS